MFYDEWKQYTTLSLEKGKVEKHYLYEFSTNCIIYYMILNSRNINFIKQSVTYVIQ